MELLGIGAFMAALVWWEFIIGTLLLVGLIWSLSEESGFLSLITLGILLSIPWGASSSVIVALSTMSFGALIVFIGIYVGLGLIWSVWKWRLFVLDEKKDYIATCESFQKTYNVDSLKNIIERKKNIDTITFWIILWPMSTFAYLLNDFIVDTVKTLARGMSTVYDKVTNSIINTK